jgi:hypothetical protein
MKQISILDRILLILTALLAAHQVVIGIDGLGTLAVASYTVAFGVMLLACLLLVIFGFDVLDSSLVLIVSTIIPVSLSLGLVGEYLPNLIPYYLSFSVLGIITVAITRYIFPGRFATLVLMVVHGVAGLMIFLLPIILSITDVMPPGFALVGIGGAMMGVGGLLLSFLKTGRPILQKDTILSILPGLLFITTSLFTLGFLFA